MFEDSLMESQNRLSSPNQHWTTIISLTLQCSIAAGIIALPLVHPDVLHLHTNAPAIALPIKPPMPRIPRVEPRTATATTSTPAALAPMSHPNLDINYPMPIGSSLSESPPVTDSVGSMSGDNDIPGGIGTAESGTGTRVILAPAAPASPVHISRGVSAGLLLAPIRPVYPPIAISTRTEGVVIIEAIISKTGCIESARATSGPTLLRGAALEAVRNARYSPYLLNGQPTEVETTITVNFKLAG